MQNLLENHDMDFDIDNSQQFATVVFDRDEDDPECLITIIRDKRITQINGNNKYNPSSRRKSTCVYVREEGSYKTIKICTIQHKGVTMVEVHEVSKTEIDYLFGGNVELW
jgi:hypothetical protein